MATGLALSSLKFNSGRGTSTGVPSHSSNFVFTLLPTTVSLLRPRVHKLYAAACWIWIPARAEKISARTDSTYWTLVWLIMGERAIAPFFKN